MAKQGEIYRVAGPVVTATGISPKMYDIMPQTLQKLDPGNSLVPQLVQYLGSSEATGSIPSGHICPIQ